MPGPLSMNAIWQVESTVLDRDANPPLALHRVRAVDQQVLEHDPAASRRPPAPAAPPRRPRCRPRAARDPALSRSAVDRHQRHDVGPRRDAASAAARTAADPSSSGRARRCGRRSRSGSACRRRPAPAGWPNTWMAPRMPASGFLTSCAIDGRHLAELGERRLLAQLLLDAHAAAEVVQDAGELALAVDRDLPRPTGAAGRSCRPCAGPGLRGRCR